MVDLMMILPEYFRPGLEFKELMRTDGAELDNLENDIQKLRNNFYIQTADEKSIALMEKLFSIVAKPERRLSIVDSGCYQNTIQLCRSLLDFFVIGFRNFLVVIIPCRSVQKNARLPYRLHHPDMGQ